MGKKKQPFYRIVAADSRKARDGRFLEVLGTYNPVVRPAVVSVFEDKMNKWLDTGAIPTDTVKTLLTQIGFTEKRNKAKRGEDVSAIELKPSISERKKKTRKMKKAALAEAEATAQTEATAKEETASTEAADSGDKAASE